MTDHDRMGQYQLYISQMADLLLGVPILQYYLLDLHPLVMGIELYLHHASIAKIMYH
jgi:hypothetical protein